MIAGLFNQNLVSCRSVAGVRPHRHVLAEFTMPVAGATAVATVLGLCGCFGVAMQPNERKGGAGSAIICMWVACYSILF